MAKLYLIEDFKNVVKETVVMKSFLGRRVCIVYEDGVVKPLIDKEVLQKISSTLQARRLRLYDRAICIEGGFFKRGNSYYIGDICGIRDYYGMKFGTGYFYEITENIYNYAKAGKSLRYMVKEIVQRNDSRRKESVIDFITGRQETRATSIALAVENARDAEYNVFPKTVRVIKKCSNNLQILDNRCREYLIENRLPFSSIKDKK